MKLLPFTRFFFDADDGPAGGGAAVADAPAPGADAVLAELDSFDAPDLGAMLGEGTPKPEDVLNPNPKPEKPEQKQPEKPEKPPVEPPARQLREELERTRKERDEFKSKAENHPRVKELEASIAELTKERDAIKADVEKTRKELDIRDPLASAKLREHQETFDQEYGRSIELVPELDGPYQNLVAEFAKLPRNDRAAFGAALSEFEQRVEDAVGPRKFNTAMELIRKGHEFITKHNQLRQEVTQNASKLAFEARQSEWTKQESDISAILDHAFDVPEDLADSDPYHPSLFLKRTLDQMDEAKRKQILNTTDTFIKRVLAGPKPKSDQDFTGLSPQEIQEKLQAEVTQHTESRRSAARILKNSMILLGVLRPFLAEHAKLRERVEKDGAATPPSPTQGGDPAKDNSEDLSNWQAPAVRI